MMAQISLVFAFVFCVIAAFTGRQPPYYYVRPNFGWLGMAAMILSFLLGGRL